jgi:hypothetical protein
MVFWHGAVLLFFDIRALPVCVFIIADAAEKGKASSPPIWRLSLPFDQKAAKKKGNPSTGSPMSYEYQDIVQGQLAQPAVIEKVLG